MVKYNPVASLFTWVAAFWSYAINHSVFWAIIAWLLGPVYLAYRLVHLLVK